MVPRPFFSFVASGRADGSGPPDGSSFRHQRKTGRNPMAQLLRVQNFNVSADGVAAGEDQTLERPFGHVDPDRMFAWAGATASWPNRTEPGGSRGLDDYMTRD